MKNYKLIEQKYIEDIHSNVSLYEHEKTKARVVTLENDMDNLAFGIGFKTPPKDSTGVAHILEHSVLGTNEKYTTKEPFFDLIKTSVATFLNAMTFNDKTIYPFSSKNKKDFYNLLDVYMTSVLFPGIYESKNIFLREGWHYELLNKEDDLTINGIVYNEMKGAYSSEDEQIYDGIRLKLFEDSTYGIDSGGNPKNIPDLSYEEFLDFHRKYYHPSNSYIYISGNLDMEEALETIDRDFLSKFEYLDVDSEIILPPARTKREEFHFEYAAAKEEKNKDYLAIGYNLGKYDNKIDAFMASFMSELLIDSEAAPVKEALLAKGLGEDVYSITQEGLVLDFNIFSKYTSSDRKDEFVETIESTLRDLVENGIDKDLLRATLNKVEFGIREGGGANAQIYRFIWAMSNWHYGKTPFEGLDFSNAINFIREKIDTNYFERYIEEKFLQNADSVVMVATPSATKNEKEAKELKERLSAYKASLSDEEIDKLIEETKAFNEFLSKEDSDEDKATLPTLELTDIKPEIEHTKYLVEEYKNSEIMKISQPTNGITFLNFMFDSSFVKEEDLFYYSLLDAFLTKLRTENYSYQELDNIINMNTGGINSKSIVLTHNKTGEMLPKFKVTMRILSDKVEKSFEILEEVLFRTKFDNKKRIKDILLELKSDMDGRVIQMGHIAAANVVKSYYAKDSYYQEVIGGFIFYNRLCDFIENFDKEVDTLIEKLEEYSSKMFNRHGLVVSVTQEENYMDNISEVKKFIDKLIDEEVVISPFEFKENKRNVAYTSSANVNYVAKGYSYKNIGKEYNGNIAVIKNLVGSDYLYTEIRAKGGAYGQGLLVNQDGDMVATSYRDPHIINTLKVYDNIADYIRNLKLTDKELKDAIIGSINTFDPNLSPQDKGELAMSRYITGLTEEEVEKNKEECLKTTLEELKEYAEVLEKVMEKEYICVIGNEEKIMEHKELFGEIMPLQR